MKGNENEMTLTIELSKQELEALRAYAQGFVEDPKAPPLYALKSHEIVHRYECGLGDAESEEDATFQYADAFDPTTDPKMYESISELVRAHGYDEQGIPDYDEDEDTDYGEYCREYGVDPERNVTAYAPVYADRTLAYGFSKSVMPAVQEDMSNHVFGTAFVEPVHGSSFGHHAGDFEPMASALRKLSEAVVRQGEPYAYWTSNEEKNDYLWARCSNCGFEVESLKCVESGKSSNDYVSVKWPFCPKCGRRMLPMGIRQKKEAQEKAICQEESER